MYAREEARGDTSLPAGFHSTRLSVNTRENMQTAGGNVWLKPRLHLKVFTHFTDTGGN